MVTIPRIALITTGGTIGSRKDPATGAVRALATSEDLIDLLPDLSSICSVRLVPTVTVNSWNMRPDMMLDVVRRIRDELDRDDVDAVVVTHGTDTVEETGLLADLCVESNKPVVFTVAMRNLSETGADGPRNLLDAFRVAASGESYGYGALLVANQQIHACRYVTKTDTVNPATFHSPEYGPVGAVTSDGVRFFHAARRIGPVPVQRLDVDVPVVKAVSGTGPEILDYLIERGVDGIIVEGSGAGNVPAEMVPGIERAIEAGIPVVLTTRVLNGFLSPTYGTGGASGGGFDLMTMGVIASPYWRSPQARIALMAAVGAGWHDARLSQLFLLV